MIAPRSAVRSAQRSVVAGRLKSALAGRGNLPPLDLDKDQNGAVEALATMLSDLSCSSSLIWWVRAELAERGVLAGVIDGIGAASRAKRIRCARLAGVLRLDDAVPWLGRLLSNEDLQVRSAAARALGTIRGARSTDALVRALYWRRGRLARIVIELARSAPDRYLEGVITTPEFSDVRLHLALALGLRGGRTGIPQLLILFDSGTRGERVAACRALGWIGDRSALPMLQAALQDQAWQVRVAALKALRHIGDSTALTSVEALLDDPSQEVREAADMTQRHLDRVAPHVQKFGWAPADSQGAVR